MRTHPGMTIMRGNEGLEKIVLFGGYDDVTSPRFPRYLATAERYSPVLRQWQWPEFGMDEAKSGVAVVSLPASWVPQCQDPHFISKQRRLTSQMAISLFSPIGVLSGFFHALNGEKY